MRLAAAVVFFLAASCAFGQVDDSYTKSLLHLDSDLTDESGRSWSAIGDAVATSTDKKFGAGSCHFDGTGDGIVTAATESIDIATGDFALDFWVNFDAIPANAHLAGDHLAYTAASVLVQYWSGDIDITINNAAVISYAWAPATGTWHHIALTRNSEDMRLFVDGSMVASASDSSDISSTYGLSYGSDSIGAVGMAGYIDEGRLSIGNARWVATFTPPTSAYGPAPAVVTAPAKFSGSGALLFGTGGKITWR
jgi:hypothetical protein